MIRAILFDLGNTLLECEARPDRENFHDAVRAVHEHLIDRGVPVPEFPAFVAAFDGIYAGETRRRGGTSDSVVLDSLSDLLARHRVRLRPLEVPELLAPCYEAISQQVVVYPDTLRTLIELKQAGLRLGVVTNTVWPKEFHMRDLARFELLSLFDGLWFSSDVGAALPDPALFRPALAELQATPEEAVFVGDDPGVDMRGARAAGVRAVLKFHPLQAKVPKDVRPDARIDALNRLPALVEQWNPAIA